MMRKTCKWMFVSLFLLMIPVSNGYGDVGEAWLADTLDTLEEQEYEASINNRGLQALNRAHGIRTYFSTHRIRVVDRTGPYLEEMELLDLSLSSLSRGTGSFEAFVLPGNTKNLRNPPLPLFIKEGEGRISIKEGEGRVSIEGVEGGVTITRREGWCDH